MTAVCTSPTNVESLKHDAQRLPPIPADGPNFKLIDGPYTAHVCPANNLGYEVFVQKPDRSLESYVHAVMGTLEERKEQARWLARRLSVAWRAGREHYPF